MLLQDGSVIGLAIAAVFVVNLLTIWRFRADKLRALAGQRRIPEADLLGLALIGGTAGAYFARHRYRHKTRKEPFSTCLALIAAVHAGVAMSFLF